MRVSRPQVTFGNLKAGGVQSAEGLSQRVQGKARQTIGRPLPLPWSWASSLPRIPPELHPWGRAQLRTCAHCWCRSDPIPQAGQLGFCLIPEKTQVPIYPLTLPMSLILSYASPPGSSALAVCWPVCELWPLLCPPALGACKGPAVLTSCLGCLYLRP